MLFLIESLLFFTIWNKKFLIKNKIVRYCKKNRENKRKMFLITNIRRIIRFYSKGILAYTQTMGS
jgi:hypothetical protein